MSQAIGSLTQMCIRDRQVNKKIRKVMAAAELDKLKKTTFEIYAAYISPLQAQYSQLTEDELLVLCLQEAGISPLAISLCFGHTDTVALNQRLSLIHISGSFIGLYTL